MAESVRAIVDGLELYCGPRAQFVRCDGCGQDLDLERHTVSRALPGWAVDLGWKDCGGNRHLARHVPSRSGVEAVRLLTLGTKRRHIYVNFYAPAFSWGWYGAPDWWWRMKDRKRKQTTERKP